MVDKEGAVEKKEESNVVEVKEEAVENKEEVTEGTETRRDQAEKILNDIFDTIKVRQEEFGKTISEYTTSLQKPLADMMETDDAIIIKTDLPGVKKEDIDIQVGEKNIDIMAKFEEETEVEGVNYIQKERSYGQTMRSIALPAKIKVKEVKADFEDSILTITLPKVEKESFKVDIS
jgi:HSP20 family protein